MYKDYYWLNEDSRTFLERDYLREGVSPEKRITEIAEAAEKILGIHGFSDKFQAYMRKGWISLSSPIWANFGANRGLPISCVDEETWINTDKGGKQAKDILIGDKVLTHKGRFRSVKKVIPTNNKSDIYILKVNNRMTPIKITGNHKVLTNLGWVEVDKLNRNVHLIAINGDVTENQELGYSLKMSDFCDFKHEILDNKINKILTSKNQKRLNKKYSDNYAKITNTIEINSELSWALGLWFAEGSVSRSRDGKPNGIRITLNSDEKDLGERFVKVFEDYFNANSGFYESSVSRPDAAKSKVSKWITFNVSSSIIGNLFASFGENCKNKTLPDWVMNLPLNFLQSFLDAMLLGDGTYRKGVNKLTLANPKLILQIYLIGLKLGKEMSLQMQDKKSKSGKTKHVYTIVFRNYKFSRSFAKSNSGIKFYDGLVYSTIDSLTKTNLICNVYDFEVEEDHSFSASGVVLHNCNGSYISDTMDGILGKVSEVGMMTKNGAGTSGYFGSLRARGSIISTGGKTSGPVHFIELFEKVADIISQSNVRRGSFAAYLDVEHPDILEFLQIREEGHAIQHLSIGVCIGDEWMKSMISGDKEKRKIWAKIIQKRFSSGYPYIFFTDTVNNNAPQVYKDKSLKIHASNLCVAGEQRVPSQFGLLTAKELYNIGNKLNLFDNEKIVKASEMKLIEKNADTYKIILENGMTHTVTDYHKVKCSIRNGKYKEIETKNVECKDLKIGDFVAIQTNKGIFGEKDLSKEAFLLGLYQGDGTQHNDTIFIDIWENDFDLENEIQRSHDSICDKYNTQISNSNNRTYPKAKFHDCITFPSKVKKKRLGSNALKKCLGFEKGYIPQWIWESNEKTHWQYLRGLLYSDGTVGFYSGKGDATQLAFSSTNREWLEELQILVANLGLQSSIRLLKKKGKNLLPDGKGGRKYYKTKDCWRLIVGNKNDCIEIENNTGFLSRKNVKIKNRTYRDNTKKYYKIKAIEFSGKQDVYCCKVDSEEHHWVCNGFISHNCSEIALPSSQLLSFVCNLCSVNILHYEDWKNSDLVETCIYLLDAVMTDYIEKTSKIPYMEAAHNFAKEHRALGLGVLGWHSFLQSKMISFESMEAKILNNQIHNLIQTKADKATIELAKLFGEPEVLKGYGRRNTTLLAIAPTTSSSFILGQVSPSIEPLNSNYFVKDLAKGKFTHKNPFLIQLLEKHEKNDDETWKSILTKGGSVQHLKFLSKEEKDVFKTFGEISQKEIIIQASARQKYIDQSQSLNLMIPPETPAKDVNQLLIYAWTLGIKTLYYQRSANPSQELARNIMACKSCEA